MPFISINRVEYPVKKDREIAQAEIAKLSVGDRYFVVVGYAEVIWKRAHAGKILLLKENLNKAKKIHENDFINGFCSVNLSYECDGKYNEAITYMLRLFKRRLNRQ